MGFQKILFEDFYHQIQIKFKLKFTDFNGIQVVQLRIIIFEDFSHKIKIQNHWLSEYPSILTQK